MMAAGKMAGMTVGIMAGSGVGMARLEGFDFCSSRGVTAGFILGGIVR